MRACRVFLSNGTDYATNINGTDEEIRAYFLHQPFTHIIKGKEVTLTCTRVDIWD